MEDPTKDNDSLRKWFEGLSEEDMSAFRGKLGAAKMCLNFPKERQLELDWKERPSGTPDLLTYKEPETGLYYETEDIMAYINNCKQRKKILSAEDIMDYEMVHTDKSQKLFFWVPRVYEHLLESFKVALTDWIVARFTVEPDITADQFQDRYIIVCRGVSLKNRAEKMRVVKDLHDELSSDMGRLLSEYLLQSPDIYEKVPSITNALYKNEATQSLVANNYMLTKSIMDKIKPMLPTCLEGSMQLVININQLVIGGDINNYTSESIYKKFVDTIIKNSPSWYISGKWVPKQNLVEEFESRMGEKITTAVLFKSLKREGLFDKIITAEKRSRINPKGPQIRLMQMK